MKTIKFISILLGITFLISSSTYVNGKEEIQKKIIGTWISNDDSNWEIQFDRKNVRKDYYEGIIEDTYQYSISNTCGLEVLNNNQYFLRSIDNSDNFEYCLIIEGVDINSSGILSFTTDRGNLITFKRK